MNTIVKERDQAIKAATTIAATAKTQPLTLLREEALFVGGAAVDDAAAGDEEVLDGF